MPLYKTITFSPYTKILIWKITETLDDLLKNAVLSENSFARLSSMKSEMHQRGFLSVRKLLESQGYSDLDLFYDPFGKPHLKDGKHISISHSHDYSSIIISDQITGIDLELRRNKIAIIAEKFVGSGFIIDKNSPDYISKLTVNWGVKESVFKIRNEVGISFKDHIEVMPFEMVSGKTTAVLHFNKLRKDFDVHFEEIGDYTLVYVFENN